METVETLPTMTAMTTMTTAMTAMTTTTGGCEIWGDRYSTNSNGTGKGDESFAQHDCISSLERRAPLGLTLLPVAYVGLNGEPVVADRALRTSGFRPYRGPPDRGPLLLLIQCGERPNCSASPGA